MVPVSASDDGDGVADIVVDEARDQIDVGGLIQGDGIEDQLDGEKLGAAVGAELGEELGRAVGAGVGRRIYEALAEAVEEGKSRTEAVGDLTDAVRGGLADASDELGGGDSAIASLRDALGGDDLREELTDAVSETVGSDEEGEAQDGPEEDEAAEDEVDTDEADEDEADDEPEGGEPEEDKVAEGEADDEGSAEDEAESESDDATGEADDAPDQEAIPEDPSEADVEELQGLRRDTLEEFLETPSYQELQSIAKEVDVKANLSREEMTERIVKTVSEASSDESEADA